MRISPVEANARNNERIGATSSIPERSVSVTDRARDQSTLDTPNSSRSSPILLALGAVGLLEIVGAALLLAGGAAAAPSRWVPGRAGGLPGWLSGPLHGPAVSLGQGVLSPDQFQVLVIAMAVGYLAVLFTARALPKWWVYGAVIAAHAILLAGPVLLSQDLFGYLSFARLGALHGLDPYTHTSAAAPLDAVFPFIGWKDVHSPYGPLFTLLSYLVVPLGLAGAVWALKTLAVGASLGAIALVRHAADRCGESPAVAVAFLGLNPVLLVSAVGGFHNDTLVLLGIAAALAYSVGLGARVAANQSTDVDGSAGLDVASIGAHPRASRAIAAIVAAIGVKLSAGLVLPFLVLAPATAARAPAPGGDRRRWIALLAAVGLLGFGTHVPGSSEPCASSSSSWPIHSVPAETRATGRSERRAELVARSVRAGSRRGAGIRVVAHDARRGLARRRGLERRSRCSVDRLAAAVVRDLGAAASRRQQRSAVARRHARCSALYALLIRLPLADPC